MVLKKCFALTALLCLLSSCALSAKDVCPYIAKGDVTLSDGSTEYTFAGLNLQFYNKSAKTVKSFTVVFYLYDAEGNPPFIGRNDISADCHGVVLPSQVSSYCISLDEYVVEIPDEPYQVDFLYVSRIEYEDGSVWEDPFGIHSMQ